MNKEEFLDTTRTDWWLVDREADPDIIELRVKLGEALGYIGEQDWYTKPERLEPLWALIERQSELASRLDAAQGPNDHKAWLETAISTREAEAAAQAAPATSNASQSAPARTAEQAPAAASAQPARPEVQRQGLFADKDAAPTPANDQSATPNKSPFAAKNAPPVQNVDVEDLRNSLSDLLADDDVALNAEDFDQAVADPQFAAKLAAAKAALNTEVESDAEDDEEEDGWDWSAIGEDDEEPEAARQ